jgi:RsmE family RNA methyltransferase
VNLVLIEPSELGPREHATLTGPRAAHLLDVTGVVPGATLPIGRLDGPLGRGTVVAVGPGRVELDCRWQAEVPPRPQSVLLLAFARPRVLARCVAAAAALGYGRILLFRSWRVDKSHLLSQRVAPARLRADLLDGLAQARRTHLPELHAFARFRPFVEDRLDALATREPRFAADPDAPTDVASLPRTGGPFTLAIGPERGFTPFEIELLATRGFRAVRLGPHPLRVETALAALTGALLCASGRDEPHADA